MLHLIMVGISILLTAIGLITSVMPIPGGVLLAVVGISLLVYYSPKAKLSIQWLRLRLHWFDRLFELMENGVQRYAPNMAQRLAETKPLAEENSAISHDEYVDKIRTNSQRKY